MKWRDLIAKVGPEHLDKEVLIVPREGEYAYSLDDASPTVEMVDMEGRFGEDARDNDSPALCILLMAD